LKLVEKNCTLHDLVIYADLECFTTNGVSLAGNDNHIHIGLYVRDEGYVSKIQFCLNLNRFGRSQVRGNNISKAHFVDLLDSANQSLEDDEAKNSLTRLNVTYGLLCEASGLWSGSSPPQAGGRRKRRRLM